MNYDDSVVILTQYASYLKINVTTVNIEAILSVHPFRGSFFAITEVLDSWNIANEAFSIKPDQVHNIPVPFIARLTSNSGEFVYVQPAANDELVISNKQRKNLSIPVDEFKKIFSGEVLIAENYESDKPGGDIETSVVEFIKPEISPIHLKPSFLIIGAQKAGTTSFYEYLKYHPDFKSPTTKELHFFNLDYFKGIDYYHDQFPEMTNKSEFTGEASPCYLIHPLVPERVFTYNPNIKLVVLFRDPVERAYSQYWMNVEQGAENLTFEEAIQLEENRLNGQFQKISEQENYNSFNYQTFSYIKRGQYAEQIKLWLSFFKKDHFLFINAEDLKQNPNEVLHRFCDFIGIPYFKIEKKVEVNSRSYPVMDLETKIKLQEYFKPYNSELNAITGITFNF